MLTALRRRTGRRSERGSELIEFAIVFPLLLLIVAAIFDFGFLFQTYEVVTNAAREGARIAILPGYTTPDVQARVLTYIQASGLKQQPTTTVTQVSIPLGNGKTISAYEVKVQYPHAFAILSPFMGYFGGAIAAVNVTSFSAMRIEAPAS